MKQNVKTNSDICHYFANENVSNSTKSVNNLFIHYDKLYSYGHHYLLAQKLGNNIMYINNVGYSNTTSKHINLITQASKQYKCIFSMDTNIEIVYNLIVKNYNRLGAARKPELYIKSIIDKYDLFYANNEILRKLEKVNKKDYLPYLTDKYKTIKSIYNKVIKDTGKLLEKLSVLAKKDKIKKQKAQQKKVKETRQLFNTYKTSYIHGLDNELLRVSKDKQSIETSQNVKVDIKECNLLYKAILNNKNVEGQRIGSYQINKVTKNIIKIGCHNILMSEVNILANNLNW